MQLNLKLVLSSVLLLVLFSCEEQVPIGKPLFSFNFNENLMNKGMAKTAIYGPQQVSYSVEQADTCLDLSLSAKNRHALTIKLNDNFSLSDYPGYTVAFWVKKHPQDTESYTILDQTETIEKQTKGWRINVQKNGTWEWWFSDGIQNWHYQPTATQKINDGRWHHIAYSYNADSKEARFYYNGLNVSVYSMSENQFAIKGNELHIGTSHPNQGNKELFNGKIDQLSVWSRVINQHEIKKLYKQKSNKKITQQTLKKSFKVMTWNLWDGGQHDGKYIGIQRISDIIEAEDPDIISLQEPGQAAVAIADALGYNMYNRSSNLSVLSRFPITKSYNLFYPDKVGCLELELDDEKKIIVCPVQLSEKPYLSHYLQSEIAQADSVLLWEHQTRGKEARFILSELSSLIFNADKKPVFISGDFNSGSHLDWTETNKINNNNLSIAYPTSTRFANKGFIDSYRHLHPDETSHFGYTVSPRFDSIMKNRTSFNYYKGDMITPVESYVIDKHPNGFPSDQAALITVYEWE